MKVAILFTGALRTIKKTIKYFKQNLLLNSNVDVFACIQNDTNISNSDWENWLRTEMREHLKSIIWFDKSENNDWLSLRDKMLSHINLAEHWKMYLKNSGSMIEYYQLYLAYLKLCLYEDTNSFKYEYIIRSRTDSIFAKPIDFHWLNLSDSEVEKRLQVIKNELTLNNIEFINETVLNYFMSTLISDNLIRNSHNLLVYSLPSKSFKCPETASDINNYVKNGQYILTLRSNNLYIVRRDFFYLIPSLAFLYGTIKSPHMDNYWFNAESQFQGACYNSDLTVFDYNTLFEDKSLYQYDEKRYFDLDFNPINPYMLYCLVRH
jgi:hypothetical protein